MVFVFDLDDTISETDEYSEKYILDYIHTHSLPIKQIAKVVRYAESKFDWDRTTANEWYKTHGDSMMLEFPTKPYAVDTINHLYDMGHTIVIATARATDWHSDPEGVTLQWLKNIGLKYHKIYIGRVDKEKVCEEEHADVFIDDDIAIVSRVHEYFKSHHPKGIALLSNTAYNESLYKESIDLPLGIERLYSFKDFLHLVGIEDN